MAVNFAFHPDALLEYAEATTYYVQHASAEIADDFIATVESAIATILSKPDRWPLVKIRQTRRFVLRRFPYVIYYRWEPNLERVTIYAVMHSRRDPIYWRSRTTASK